MDWLVLPSMEFAASKIFRGIPCIEFLVIIDVWYNNLCFILKKTSWQALNQWTTKNFIDVAGSNIFVWFISLPLGHVEAYRVLAMS